MKVHCDRLARPVWEAIPVPERVELKSLIPTGARITILASNTTPPYTVRLFRGDELLGDRRGYDIAGMIRFLCSGVVVTADADGFVTSIEEAS